MKHGLVLFPKSTLGNRPNAFEWWREEAERCGRHVDIAFFEDIIIRYDRTAEAYISGRPVGDVDFAVMRGYNAAVSLFFENKGTPVFNSWDAMHRSHDKRLTHMCLCASGLPTPKTIWSGQPSGYSRTAQILGNKFIVKQVDGSRGENVFLVDDDAGYSHAFATCRGNALAQRYIETSCGRDVRVWVVGDNAVGAVLRSSDTSFISNYSRGGKATAFRLDNEAAALAVAATKAVGLVFSGIDLLFDNNGYTVCEVNGNAGFRTLSAVSDVNIIRKLFEYISDRV